MKKITIAIAGCGSRGLDTYASCQDKFPDLMQIVAAADNRPERLEVMKKRFGLSDEQCYSDAESMLEEPKLADAMFISTHDRMHYPQAMAALNKGYHLLLEKPIAVTEQECIDIAKLAEAKKLHVVVCHVLRYTVFYQKLKELLNQKIVGDIVSIQAIEKVGYWHQAHSYVRGNWRNSAESSPMILAKCSHDMDILLWLTGKNCQSVSSYGNLMVFKKENAPAGAPLRCTEPCPAADTCPYNAVKYYMDIVKKGNVGWPVNVLHHAPTEETIMESLKTGPYGRCVYHCDNDVVDHQVVNLLLEGGTTVSFTMCAFTVDCAREIRIMGTMGEIFGDFRSNTISVMPFGKDTYDIDISQLTSDFSGHGGGDARMVEEFLRLLNGEPVSESITTIDHSIESHLVALAAERSRLNNGESLIL
jgi:predicted dehydrogenase